MEGRQAALSRTAKAEAQGHRFGVLARFLAEQEEDWVKQAALQMLISRTGAHGAHE